MARSRRSSGSTRNTEARCVVCMSKREKEFFESLAKSSGKSLNDYLYSVICRNNRDSGYGSVSSYRASW